MALNNQLHYSRLSPETKHRGSRTLQLFSKAVVNGRIQTEQAHRLLASLFQGEVPSLERIVSTPIPDGWLESWLQLVDNSFSSEFAELAQQPDRSFGMLNEIIDGYLNQSQ